MILGSELVTDIKKKKQKKTNNIKKKETNDTGLIQLWNEE